jgi:hypothetical protein
MPKTLSLPVGQLNLNGRASQQTNVPQYWKNVPH